MKTSKSVQSVLMTWLIVALLLSACGGVAGPQVGPGQVEAIQARTTARLLSEAINGSYDAKLWVDESRANATAVRYVYEEVTEFVNVDVRTLKEANGTITGNLCRTCDWQGIEQMLKDMGYKAMTGAEFAAYYTAAKFTQWAELLASTFPTMLVLPVGFDQPLDMLYPEEIQ